MILFTRTLRLLWTALREIFDERAYDRFLIRTNAQPTPESYRAFLTERTSAAPKPRCC